MATSNKPNECRKSAHIKKISKRPQIPLSEDEIKVVRRMRKIKELKEGELVFSVWSNPKKTKTEYKIAGGGVERGEC